MKNVRPELSRTKAAAIGAMVAVVLIALSQAVGNSPPNTSGLPYWGGVGIGGALIGAAVAAFLDWRRR
jgi:prolipoprotein diacylglyceryltransferase